MKANLRIITLAQSLTVILTATAATAQTRPVSTATNATVSAAESEKARIVPLRDMNSPIIRNDKSEYETETCDIPCRTSELERK